MYVDWPSRVIHVLKDDMTLVQVTPSPIYVLDLDWFRLKLKDLEDDEEGMVFPDTHIHNPPITVGGVLLARTVELINNYTVTFEPGVYQAELEGANSNVADVTNLNLVSIRSKNSAGLIISETGTSGLTPEESEALINIDSNVTLVQEDQEEIKDDIDEIKDDIDVINDDTTVIKADTTEIKTDISVMKIDLSSISQGIIRMETDVGVIQTDINYMQADLASLNQKAEKCHTIPAFRLPCPGTLPTCNDPGYVSPCNQVPSIPVIPVTPPPVETLPPADNTPLSIINCGDNLDESLNYVRNS